MCRGFVLPRLVVKGQWPEEGVRVGKLPAGCVSLDGLIQMFVKCGMSVRTLDIAHSFCVSIMYLEVLNYRCIPRRRRYASFRTVTRQRAGRIGLRTRQVQQIHPFSKLSRPTPLHTQQPIELVPADKVAGSWNWPPTSISYRGKEWVGLHLHSLYVPWWRGHIQLYIDSDTYWPYLNTGVVGSNPTSVVDACLEVVAAFVLSRIGWEHLGLVYRVCSRVGSKLRTRNVVSRIRGWGEAPLRAFSRNRTRIVHVFRVCPFTWMRTVSCQNIFNSNLTPGINSALHDRLFFVVR